MEYLSWDLAILSRAVAYNNLSSASSHVGLSQPQLSRIVAKLEEQLGVTLLDRETKRKSGWTPTAFKVAEIYNNTFHQFRSSISQLATDQTPQHLRIACLEGLIPQAIKFCSGLYEETTIGIIELNVYDTNVLEEKFLKNEIDIVFAARRPGTKKFKNVVTIGYQSLGVVKAGSPTVYSSFEFATALGKTKPSDRVFVSNSLAIRSTWMDTIGGTGSRPSALRAKQSGKKNEVPVLLVAHDNMPAPFWKEITKLL